MTTATPDDERAVWDRVQAIYAGFQSGDSAVVDALLAQDVTIWDSAEFALVRGLDDLARLRARRPASDEPAVTSIDATDPVIDVWGDLALVRHLLRVRLRDGREEIIRNTSVWRRSAGQWYAVHNHEDVASPSQMQEDPS